MKKETLEKVIAHGKSLINYFHLPDDTDPVKLCRQLRKIEKSIRSSCLAYCNGLIDIDTLEAEENKAKDQLKKNIRR